MQGNEHLKKVAEFMSGCWLCGIKALDIDDSHFDDGMHTKAMARVEAFGVDTAKMGAHGWIQLKGGKQGLEGEEMGVFAGSPGALQNQ